MTEFCDSVGLVMYVGPKAVRVCSAEAEQAQEGPIRSSDTLA